MVRPCRPFIAAFIAFAIAQLLKVFTFWYSERRWDYTRVVGSGGMPSSHTACVSAETCAFPFAFKCAFLMLSSDLAMH